MRYLYIIVLLLTAGCATTTPPTYLQDMQAYRACLSSAIEPTDIRACHQNPAWQESLKADVALGVETNPRAGLPIIFLMP